MLGSIYSQDRQVRNTDGLHVIYADFPNVCDTAIVNARDVEQFLII